jgi:hypothetical protein
MKLEKLSFPHLVIGLSTLKSLARQGKIKAPGELSERRLNSAFEPHNNLNSSH